MLFRWEKRVLFLLALLLARFESISDEGSSVEEVLLAVVSFKGRDRRNLTKKHKG